MLYIRAKRGRETWHWRNNDVVPCWMVGINNNMSYEVKVALDVTKLFRLIHLCLWIRRVVVHLYGPPRRNTMFTYAGGSVWVVWPSEQQMGQAQLVESRLGYFTGHVFPLQHLSLQWNEGARQCCHFLISNELAGLGNGVIVSRRGASQQFCTSHNKNKLNEKTPPVYMI